MLRVSQSIAQQRHEGGIDEESMDRFEFAQRITFAFTSSSFVGFILAITTNYVCSANTDTCWVLGDNYFDALDTINNNSTWSAIRTLHIVIILMMAIVWIYYPVGNWGGAYNRTDFKIVEFSLQTLSFCLGIAAIIIAVGGYNDSVQLWGFGYYATVIGTVFILPAHLLWIYYYFKVKNNYQEIQNTDQEVGSESL